MRLLTRVFVQPVKRLSVLLSEGRRNPDDRRRRRPCGVCQDLTEMAVVCGCELVLDDEDGVVGDVLPNEIEREATYRVFRGLKVEIDP